MGLPNVLTETAHMCSAVVLLKNAGREKPVRVSNTTHWRMLWYDINVWNVML